MSQLINRGSETIKTGTKRWESANDFARFDLKEISPRGPNGGINVIKNVTVRAVLNMSITTTPVEGEDAHRFMRNLSVNWIDGFQSYQEIPGDAMRPIGYATNGASRQHEHQDLAASATTDREFAALVPLELPFAYWSPDCAVPVEFIKEIVVGMADAAQFTAVAGATTIHSGYYWLEVEVYEQFGIVNPARYQWKSTPLAASQDALEVFTGGGRLQDAFLYVPGANGGQSLANLTDIGFLGSQQVIRLGRNDLKLAYARARGVAYNSFSAIGSPLTSDPFVASASGTLRAIAIKLTTGDKVFTGAEREQEKLVLTLASALPANARLLTRVQKPVSEELDAIIRRTHAGRVNGFQYKTADKTRQHIGAWAHAPELAKYLPRKYGMFDSTGKRISR